MLFALTTLALALVGTVHANPVARSTLTASVDSVSASKDIPVVSLDLGSVSPHGNVTVGTAGVHTSSADAIYPATIFVCRALGCGSCTGYDLSIQPHNTCLGPGFNFVSAYINQPSNQGLPYGVYTGPTGCGSFAQIPQVNTCYDASNYIGADFKLT
ncbi:hypothetical protein L227DRAFT_601766 [Lentinus tigrinus ALCF2SS1-6]|uniref:Uncharacterized protein n=3 Tax=Lentinus tigrinus TaxID=5365 RepID=A0A5C2S4Z1_9APHY|nr:hypothetical protein L227DRAFT_601766 [Lentinus tigrinus ALCF2SS1-6]